MIKLNGEQITTVSMINGERAIVGAIENIRQKHYISIEMRYEFGDLETLMVLVGCIKHDLDQIIPHLYQLYRCDPANEGGLNTGFVGMCVDILYMPYMTVDVERETILQGISTMFSNFPKDFEIMISTIDTPRFELQGNNITAVNSGISNFIPLMLQWTPPVDYIVFRNDLVACCYAEEIEKACEAVQNRVRGVIIGTSIGVSDVTYGVYPINYLQLRDANPAPIPYNPGVALVVDNMSAYGTSRDAVAEVLKERYGFTKVYAFCSHVNPNEFKPEIVAKGYTDIQATANILTMDNPYPDRLVEIKATDPITLNNITHDPNDDVRPQS